MASSSLGHPIRQEKPRKIRGYRGGANSRIAISKTKFTAVCPKCSGSLHYSMEAYGRCSECDWKGVVL